MSQPPNTPGNGGYQPNPEDPRNSWNQQPQGQPYQQQPYQQPYPPQPPKKKSGKTAILLVVGLLLACCVIGGIIAVVSMGGDNNTTVSNGSGSDEKKADSGPAFKGKTNRDVSVNPGATVTKDKVAVTATKLTTDANALDEKLLCSTVTIKNDGDKQELFNMFDWKLQNPSGTSTEPTIPPNESDGLQSGEVAPGGETSGTVCFEGDPSAKPGEYVLLYDNSIFSTDRYAWVNKL